MTWCSELWVVFRLLVDGNPRAEEQEETTPSTPMGWGKQGRAKDLVPAWAYDAWAWDLGAQAVHDAPNVLPLDSMSGFAMRCAYAANLLQWTAFVVFPCLAFALSTCDPSDAFAKAPPWILALYMPVLALALYLELRTLRIWLPAQVVSVDTFSVMGVALPFHLWFGCVFLLSAVSHMDMGTTGVFIARVARSETCPGNTLHEIWHQTMAQSLLGRMPGGGVMIECLSFRNIVVFTWALIPLQLLYSLHCSVPTRFLKHHAGQKNEWAEPTEADIGEVFYNAWTERVNSWRERVQTRTCPDGESHRVGLMSLADSARMVSVGFFANDAAKDFYAGGKGPSGPYFADELRRKSMRSVVFLLCESAIQPAVQASALALLRAATAGHTLDRQTALSVSLSILTAGTTLLKAMVEWRSLRGFAHDSLSAARPVRSSWPDCAQNLVDGTPSEWLVDSPEPVWIEVDLKEAGRVDEVWVQWWGDYGKKTDLGLYSKGAGQGDAFVQRGCRVEDTDELNGWTQLKRGWEALTSVVRFELREPQKDCFGLGKCYGMRRLEVLGPLRVDRSFLLGLAAFAFGAALLFWSLVKTYAAAFHCSEGLYNIGVGCVTIHVHGLGQAEG